MTRVRLPPRPGIGQPRSENVVVVVILLPGGSRPIWRPERRVRQEAPHRLGHRPGIGRVGDDQAGHAVEHRLALPPLSPAI